MKVHLSAAMLRLLVTALAIFPCFFGPALRGTGIIELPEGVAALFEEWTWPDVFSAHVYRASSGAQGEHHAWVEGGRQCSAREGLARRLRSRRRVAGIINQVRIYDAESFTITYEVSAELKPVDENPLLGGLGMSGCRRFTSNLWVRSSASP